MMLVKKMEQRLFTRFFNQAQRRPSSQEITKHQGVFFFKPIVAIIKGLVKGEKESVDYVIYIIVGTIPIVLFALIFRTQIEQSFTNIPIVGIFLGITGVILLLTSIVKRGNRKVKLLSAFLIGISQMFAVFPGISRSGMTISTGLFSKVSPEESFNFSFLLSLPAILGANLLKLKSFFVCDFINKKTVIFIY